MISINTNKPAYRSVAAAAILLAAGLSLTACDGGPLSSNMDKQQDHAWAAATEDGAKSIAPRWIPSSATDVRERVRTTGNERILSYAGSIKDLPASCKALPEGTKPVAVPEGSSAKAADFLANATLSADWWPAGQEAKTTTMCGKWWVSEAQGRVYAFAPELKTVAERIK